MISFSSVYLSQMDVQVESMSREDVSIRICGNLLVLLNFNRVCLFISGLGNYTLVGELSSTWAPSGSRTSSSPSTRHFSFFTLSTAWFIDGNVFLLVKGSNTPGPFKARALASATILLSALAKLSRLFRELICWTIAKFPSLCLPISSDLKSSSFI